MNRFVAKVVLSLVFIVGTIAEAQTLAGLRIGDPVSRLATLGTPVATDPYKSFVVKKWNLANGNELSVTTDASGRIVYLESDWNRRPDGRESGLQDFTFGTTTLSDIRKRFGSNGFVFKRRGGVMDVPDGAVMMNSYEVGTNVVTFITRIALTPSPAKKAAPNSPVAERAILDAITLASAAYAKSEWGNRIYDPKYKKVEWLDGPFAFFGAKGGEATAAHFVEMYLTCAVPCHSVTPIVADGIVEVGPRSSFSLCLRASVVRNCG